MSEETKKETGAVTKSVATKATSKSSNPANDTRGGRRGGPRRGGRGNRGPRRGRRMERPKPEFEQKMISIRRVTRVMAGGRRFNFSIAMVIGDKKGRVGVGIGKANDVQLATEKALRNARRNMITIPLTKNSSIAHDVQTKLASAVVMIKPAPGRGLVAGASVRTVLELAGVKDITAKILSRSKNTLNNARATVAALAQLD